MEKGISEIIYENTVSAEFVKRTGRFTAQVLIDGCEETVHIKNTGRLDRLLIPRSEIMLQASRSPRRKTAYDVISVNSHDLGWVNIDSLAPNVLMKMYFDSLGSYETVKPEFCFGDSRFDFYLESRGRRFLHEVKGCTLANDVLTGIGYFPDAPTLRAIKHLKELSKASSEGYKCSLDFVIQINGIKTVFPNDAIQPEFRHALFTAVQSGVSVNSVRCHVEKDSIKITDVSNDSNFYTSQT